MVPDAVSSEEAELLIRELGEARNTGTTFEQWAQSHVQNLEILKPLNRALGYVFSGFEDVEFAEGQDFYDRLLQKLEVDQSWIIVSLNYDSLIEDALNRMGIHFCYQGFEYGGFGTPADCGNAVRLFKPHGSYNWRGTQPQASANAIIAESTMSVVEMEGKQITIEDRALVATNRQNFLANLDNKSWQPLMATFCADKSTMTNYKKLLVHRRDCLAAVCETEQSFLIGIRPTPREVDSTTFEILKALDNAGQGVYVNPSHYDCSKLNEDFRCFKCIRQTLEQYLFEDLDVRFTN